MHYIVKRIIKCDIGTYFIEPIYNDINTAFMWCELYNNTCCAPKCGCQFQVEETNLNQIPLVFNQTNTYTYTPSYTYTPYKYYYSNSPLWYYPPTSTSTASTSTFTITI